MTSRPNPFQGHFALVKPLIDFGTTNQKELDPTIAELVKIRASQINGCATCLQMHTREARKNGESEERIYLLDGWRESPLYNDKERAALAWTEALTRVDREGGSDEAYQALSSQFSEEEQVRITLLIGAINAFNRVNVGLRVPLAGTVGKKVA
ncbi:carboxymuconolactone decarboxylase family protein [Pelagibacterium sp. 26DY04]|uniref:carboxymuconolactone decarboxylase family protein n=1 Tax=unclassified Pelagibacterium TaxID=2623280 RepID=UPI002815969F|nr:MULTISPECIES: carboxymuconolactone decarboxylase family protein [unclassified Pelagibacterium]WMT88734.1 carboxymuconolactone decarboxylase family protein [Pelagibacterium sp. 26DY04]WMT90609.1 carboxymuconolactone decarboxylase family protein [Pelagibacterium sp. H642]